MKSRHVRPRIQRAFFRWLSENSRRFAVSIRISRRTDRRIEISFIGLNPIVSITLSKEIWVCITWENEIFDCLCNFEADPQHVEKGCICKFCEPEMREIFSDREALWRDHLFEPFLEWVNTVLAQASHIGLYGTDKGSTWAKLIQGQPILNEIRAPNIALFPLWQ